jgi:hypothetical protein
MSSACTQTDTDSVENAAGALHKARPATKASKGALPAVDPAKVKNLDKAFDIEESKPADTKNLDKAFDIEESKPADTKNLDKAFDIEESKPADTKTLDKAFDIEESGQAKTKNPNGAKSRPITPKASGPS